LDLKVQKIQRKRGETKIKPSMKTITLKKLFARGKILKNQKHR
jgi:hypothetical protein